MRRRSMRYASFLKGVIGTKDQAKYSECIVTDISATGAKLFLTGPVTLPEECFLHIESRQVHLGCDIVYHQDNVVGVKFQRPDLPMPEAVEQGFARARSR
ncbi:MAG: PilZ domain-containing protein [Proteobacteria bacterium]|nr:PilZ domain-containing protein [Pseudomonadota bacterium]